MTLFHRHFGRPGSSPGTLEAWPQATQTETVIHVFDYDEKGCTEKQLGGIEEILPFQGSTRVTWIDIVGLSDIALLERLGEVFELHPLALEDVLNVGQRPKVEDFEHQHFIVMKLLYLHDELVSEQISMFVGQGYVITLQEKAGDTFDPVRDRIRQGKGRIRGMGADYLAYALIDTLVDQFFPLLETFGERIELLEDVLVENPGRETLHEIHQIKRSLLAVRRAAWPQREVVNALQRDETGLIGRETKIFLRDCYDHSVQIMDVVETFRDLATGMMDVYLSSLSNRMNEIMKVLTIIATIFIPLTFIAGIYGMNFNPESSPWNMPELNWHWGYPACLGLMAVVALGMLAYFRRKKWL